MFALRVGAAAFGGLALGFLGGMVGFGQGRSLLLLVYWVAEDPINAPGTNNAVTIMASATGSWSHFREARVAFGVLALMGIPSVVGAFLGGFYGGLVPRAILLVFVGLIGIAYSYNLLTGSGGGHQNRRKLSPSESDSAWQVRASATRVTGGQGLKAISLSFAIGLLGGMVGLGLGQLRLPTMLQILRLDPRIAVGTSLAIGTLTGCFGFLGRVLHLQVDWAVLVILGPMAMLGSYIGAKQTGKMSPQRVMRLMGVVIGTGSVLLFWLAYTQL